MKHPCTHKINLLCKSCHLAIFFQILSISGWPNYVKENFDKHLFHTQTAQIFRKKEDSKPGLIKRCRRNGNCCRLLTIFSNSMMVAAWQLNSCCLALPIYHNSLSKERGNEGAGVQFVGFQRHPLERDLPKKATVA